MSYDEYREKSHKSMQARVKAMGGTPGRSTAHPEGALKRADGGFAAGKGVAKAKKPHTQVNVVIAPHAPGAPVGGGAGAAVPVPAPSRAAPQPIPMPVASGPRPMPAGPVPGGMPGAKRGGKVAKRATGGKVHMTAGAGSGEGRIEKVEGYGKKAGARKAK